MVKYYLVPEDELKELLSDSLYAAALDSLGVDNWTEYGCAIDDFLEECRADYNIPDDVDFDFDDMAEVDIQGYQFVEMDK